jgi:hypothetical protein
VGFTSDGVVIGMDPHKRSATFEVMSAALTLEDLAREAYDGARHDAHYRTGALDKPNGRALTGHYHTIRSSRDRDSRSDTARFNRPAPLTGRHQQPEAIMLRLPAEVCVRRPRPAPMAHVDVCVPAPMIPAACDSKGERQR